jgi:hypothetical protein
MTRTFAKFARKERISNQALIEAIRAADIRPDADLGGGIIKQRIARMNQGKSGGYRTIIFYRREDVAFFVYGFAKSALDNITPLQETAFRKLVPVFLEATDEQIVEMMLTGKVKEVPIYDQE